MLHLHKCELNFSVPCQLPVTDSIVCSVARNWWKNYAQKERLLFHLITVLPQAPCHYFPECMASRRFGLAFIDFLVYPLNFLNGVLNEGAFGNV